MTNPRTFVSVLPTSAPGKRREDLPELPADRQGKLYLDLPHRYFATPGDLLAYAARQRQLGANVCLLLPHFMPSFSEYVVKDYQRPAPLFGDWAGFATVMRELAALGFDRMIDVPFNHADWQAEHLQRGWYKQPDTGGIEAGADDTDADGVRVRINWGAYELDNGNRELQRYWLEKVLFPHCEHYHVNAVRIDAAWGLDPGGLTTLITETRRRFPHVWFVAENLGMAPLLKLARSGLDAGSDRFFNNFYWYSGGRYIPSDMYQLWRGGGGRPTCSIWASHDTLMPALKVHGRFGDPALARLNDKALHRQVIERERITGPAGLPSAARDAITRRLQLDYLLAALVSTDTMWVAGAERLLLARLDVCRSGPADFAAGIDSPLPDFIAGANAWRRRLPVANAEGLVVPFGGWKPGEVGIRGYLKKTAVARAGGDWLLVAGNFDLQREHAFTVPARCRDDRPIANLTDDGLRQGRGRDLPTAIVLPPGTACLLLGTFAPTA